MKNYNEIAESIFERRDQYIAQKRKRMKVVKRTTSIVSCFCLVALLGIGAWQTGLLKQTPPNNPITSLEGQDTGNKENSKDSSQQTPDENSNLPSKDNSQQTPAPPDRIWSMNINKISGTITGAKKYYDPKLYHEEVWNTAQMAEYLGTDFSLFGDGFTYSGDDKFTVTIANDGTIAYDTATLCFNNSSLVIRISKIGLPFDCIYQFDSDNKTIFKMDSGKNISVLIGETSDGLFIADFEYHGLNFRITANELSENDFSEAINAVLKATEK